MVGPAQIRQVFDLNGPGIIAEDQSIGGCLWGISLDKLCERHCDIFGRRDAILTISNT
jgi:hypothetical protein